MADPLDILSGARGSSRDDWSGTLANLGNLLASIPERRARDARRRMELDTEQANAQTRAGELQLRQQNAQSQEAAKAKIAQMDQAVNAIVSGAMVDGPDGTKRFDRKRIMEGFARVGAPLELQSRTLKSLDDVEESGSGLETARREHAARVLNAVLEAPDTQQAAMMGIAEGKANGWLRDSDIEPLYMLLASDRDPKPAIKQLRDSLSDKYHKQPERPVSVAPGASLVDPATGKVVYSAPAKAPDVNTGSFEDFNSATDPEKRAKILADRKAYMQADDRPIHVSTGRDSLTPNMESSVINRLSNQWTTASKPAREMERQVSVMDAGMTAARRGDMNAGSQAVVMTFNKILDPQSVVRESEFDRSAAGQSLMNRAKGAVEKLVSGGAKMPLSELEKFATLAKEIAAAQRGSRLSAIKERLGKTADHYKIPRDLVFESDAPPSDTSGKPPKRATNPYPK